MTDQQYADIVEHATNTIIGDKQGILTVDEMKRITWLVAEILTGDTTLDNPSDV